MFCERLYLRLKKIYFEQDIHIANRFCGKHVDFASIFSLFRQSGSTIFFQYCDKSPIMVKVLFGLGGRQGKHLRN